MDIYKHGNRREAKVALTFDDGPNPPCTEEVITLLSRAEVRATFFVIGKWVSLFPDTVELTLRVGHVVGNHSYEHRRGVCDFERAEAVVSRLVGVPSRFLRVPYFDYAAFGPCLVEGNLSSRVVDADIQPRDFEHTDPEAIAGRILENPRLAGGSIIVLHDGAEDPSHRLTRPRPMISALPAIIEGLRKRGLVPVGLDELTLAHPIEWRGRAR